MNDERERKAYEWRKRAARNMPALAARVFALRNVSYMGCGFHWSMEKRLGSIMMHLNDYDNPITFAGQIGLEVALESLYQNVTAAEASVRKESA